MALRNNYPRFRRRGEADPDFNCDTGDDDFGNVFLTRFKAECVHFRNFDFRMSVSEYCVNSGTLHAVRNRCYRREDGSVVTIGGEGSNLLETTAQIVGRHGGVACHGRRTPIVEVRQESVLDAAHALESSQCNKVAIIFAAHQPQKTREGQGMCLEEKDLVSRTNWIEVFMHIQKDNGGTHVGPSALGEKYVKAGAEECLLVQNLQVLRGAGEGRGAPGPFLARPREVGVIVGFLPKSSPDLAGGASTLRNAEYADTADRVQYRAQVESALRLASLLDCDGLVVGCGEGIVGSEVYGHPLSEVSEVWRDALMPKMNQFRRVVFALGEETQQNRRDTTRALAEALNGKQLHA